MIQGFIRRENPVGDAGCQSQHPVLEPDVQADTGNIRFSKGGVNTLQGFCQIFRRKHQYKLKGSGGAFSLDQIKEMTPLHGKGKESVSANAQFLHFLTAVEILCDPAVNDIGGGGNNRTLLKQKMVKNITS